MYRCAIVPAIAAFGLSALTPLAASAQDGIDLRSAVAASIVHDIMKDKQAERDVSRQPYMSWDHGTIASGKEARRACVTEILAEAGKGAAIVGSPSAHSMSTGWEVEGNITPPDGGEALPFVCSVRNGLVSGTLIRR